MQVAEDVALYEKFLALLAATAHYTYQHMDF